MDSYVTITFTEEEAGDLIDALTCEANTLSHMIVQGRNVNEWYQTVMALRKKIDNAQVVTVTRIG